MHVDARSTLYRAQVLYHSANDLIVRSNTISVYRDSLTLEQSYLVISRVNHCNKSDVRKICNHIFKLE